MEFGKRWRKEVEVKGEGGGRGACAGSDGFAIIPTVSGERREPRTKDAIVREAFPSVKPLRVSRRKKELLANWEIAQSGGEVYKIKPLEK